MVKNTNKLILIDSKFSGKKLFFLNLVGYMEQIWLLQPKNNTWEKLSPKIATDLNSREYVNCYSQIDNHVVTINNQEKIFLIGYSDCDEINLYIYHPEENVWEKLNSPEVTPIFGITQYDVMRTNVINIKGKLNISLLLRSVEGISLYLYDITIGSWSKIAGTPNWSDINGWKDPSNYTTIETHVIKSLSKNTDNSQQNANTTQNLLIVGRAVHGIELHCYDPSSKTWEELPQAQRCWGDNTSCKSYIYYSTFRTKIINENNLQKLYIQMRFYHMLATCIYDFKSKNWSDSNKTPPPNYNYSDQAGWATESNYSTINCLVIKAAREQDKLFLFSRNSNGIDLRFFHGNTWTATTSSILGWSNAAGWNQTEYYSSIGIQTLADFSEPSRDNFIAYTKSPISNDLEIYIYKVAEDSWSKLVDGPSIFTQEWHNPSYYQSKKAAYENLCVAIKNSRIEQIQELLSKDIDLFYGVQFKIILDNYKLYLIDTLDENNFTKIAAIKKHALILLNNNRVYFVKDGMVERDHNYQPKWITIVDRKGFPKNNKIAPILQLGDKSQEFIEMVLSQVGLDLTIAKNATDIPIDYYQKAPIGLALKLTSETFEEIICRLTDSARLSDEILQQAVVYFYLAAKQKNTKDLFLAKKLMDSFLAQKKKPDLKFMINQNIIDSSILGAKDFFETAILNKNSAMIEWILSDQYIKNKIFQPTIQHLKFALECLQISTVKRLLNLKLFKSSELSNLLESNFFADGNQLSYLEYTKNINNELYMLLGKELFFAAVTDGNQTTFSWLLEQGFWFNGYQHKLLPLLSKLTVNTACLDDTTFLGLVMKNHNYGLVTNLLQNDLLSMPDFIDYLVMHKINIDVQLLEHISDQLVDFLQSTENANSWIKLMNLSEDNSISRSLWNLMIYLPIAVLNETVTTMCKVIFPSTSEVTVQEQSTNTTRFLSGMSNFVFSDNSSNRSETSNNKKNIITTGNDFGISNQALLGFFYFAEISNITMIKKFLSINQQYSNYFLNGNNQTTPLIIACANNDIILVEFLLSKMQIAQINKSTFKSGYYQNITALWISLANKNWEIIELILNQPGIITEHGKSWHNEIEQGKLLSCQDLDPAKVYLAKNQQVEFSLPYYRNRVAPVIMLEATREIEINNGKNDIRKNNSLRLS